MSSSEADAALARLLQEGLARAATIDPHHTSLWETLATATEGGKRFRPGLVIATHDALGGTSSGAAAEVGAAVELLHTALVIHDDVIDGDHLRRGRPNVSGTFRGVARSGGASPQEVDGYGLTAAILAGDLALSTAVRAVATCGAAPGVVSRLLDLFDAALHTTASGELADVRMSMSHTEVTIEESLVMEAQKTSAYSFCLPLQAGAILAGASDETVRRLEEAGRAMGIAFQLVDDLVGVFGDPEHSGKSATSDLRTRKQTPLVVHARSTDAWDQIDGYLGRSLDPHELDEVRDLLGASGSRRFVEDLAEEHLTASRSVMQELGIEVELLDQWVVRLPVLAGDGAAA